MIILYRISQVRCSSEANSEGKKGNPWFSTGFQVVTHCTLLGISSMLEADNLISTLSCLKLLFLNVGLGMKLGDLALRTGTLLPKHFAASIQVL